MTTPERLRTMRTVTALVAPDTVELLAERVTNLLSHGRRITITHRYTHLDSPPDVSVGLTLDGEPDRWKRQNGVGLTVRLKPGLTAFGFSAYDSDPATESDAWRAYYAAAKDIDRCDLTQVDLNGGLPGDGPARDDQIVIRHWNSHGVCTERVIAFDHDTGHHDLSAIRDELREHVANLSDKQPWDNRDMLERVLAALEAHADEAGSVPQETR